VLKKNSEKRRITMRDPVRWPQAAAAPVSFAGKVKWLFFSLENRKV
jgi:hypothetical protein